MGRSLWSRTCARVSAPPCYSCRRRPRHSTAPTRHRRPRASLAFRSMEIDYEKYRFHSTMDRHAEDVSANFRDFGPASRKCATFLGKPGKGSGQHAGACEWLVRTAPYGNSHSARSRRAYVRNPDIRRSDPGVSRLGQRSVRADHGRRTCIPATNHGDNRRARIAAISTFGNRKGGRAPAIRVEGPNPLQDYVIGVPRKVTRMSALDQKRTFRSGWNVLLVPTEVMRQMNWHTLLRRFVGRYRRS